MTHDIKIEIDGKKYMLAELVEHKEGDPIPFYFTKKDMEYFIWTINTTFFEMEKRGYHTKDLLRIKRDLQQRIDKANEKGFWK